MNPKDETIYRKAMAAAPQPIGVIDGHVDTPDKLRVLIIGNEANPRDSKYVGVVADYRLISRLFPSSQLHSADFGLYHIDTDRLREWAAALGLRVNYLAGTEGMSLRPLHFEFM